MVVIKSQTQAIIWVCRIVGRLQTLKPSIGTQAPRLKPLTTSDNRMSGSALQARRLKMWTETPHCAMCGRLTQYPYGFQLDHIMALCNGGRDTEANCQILCVDHDDMPGCHSIKTREDMKP